MSAAAAVGVRLFTMHLHHDGVLRPGTRRLGAREALKLHGAQGELRILAGSVWLTRSSDPTDYLVEPGETFEVHATDVVVIEVARVDERTIVHWAPRIGTAVRWRDAARRVVRAATQAARALATL